jgi:hypothetical protein
MPTITGVGRDQIAFSSLETQISKDNEVPFINAFVDKLDLEQLSIQCLIQTSLIVSFFLKN